MHAGAHVRRTTSGSTTSIELDFVFHEPADVAAMVGAAGLTEIEWYRRGPLTHRDETTERLYVIGRKP